MLGAAGVLYKLQELISKVDVLNSKGEVGRIVFPLDPARPSYGVNSGEMLYYLQHSLVSICSAELIAKKLCFCEDKFKEVQVFKNVTLDSQAAVAVDPLTKVIVVSYRMTVSDENWVTNYKDMLVSHPLLDAQEKVHQGYLEYSQSLHRQLEPAVLSLLANPKYLGYGLHITGYSLGASAAAISLPIWKDLLTRQGLQNKMQMFTYAGPRPGNIEFSLYLDTLGIPIARYAKQGDVVPHVPDQSAGYSQVGLEFYDVGIPLIKKDITRCAANAVEDANCGLSDSKFLVIHHLTPFQSPLPVPPFC
ncbi:hypothetical protein DSO57_1001233 [Entomophthora muscae]|uniref:Uncharacterized protein n=1 Tax=Entomophthora muscae TaxID=34485 RepID=A0ACC2SM09_9FUNG|nr:hypothetical protein DSO57_1001233 [Entomophthora muscae]